MNWWESQKAKSRWSRYGTDLFYKAIRVANGQLRRSKHKYERVGDRINYAFVRAELNNTPVILNLFHKDNMLSSEFAIAHYENDVTKVAKRRALLQLAELGLSFISLPSWIKSNVVTYIKSYYYQQQLTEGALYAYFESNGNLEMKDVILHNQMNPFMFR